MWVNGEMSVDLRLAQHVMIRFFGGLGHVVTFDECYTLDNDGDTGIGDRSRGACPRDAGPLTLPFLGIAFRVGV